MKTIQLSNGGVALVDDDTHAVLSRHRWNRTVDGHARRRSGSGGTIMMHREVIGARAGEQVDHINGNPLDNRRANLRLATQQQNEANRGPRRHNKSGLRGVWLHKPGRWRACIRENGATVHLGVFLSAEAAGRAYDAAARRIHGEFARPNFPNHLQDDSPIK